MVEEGSVSNIKDKAIEYLRNPYVLLFIFILIVGIAIRLKYLFINGDGLWWDEVGWLQAGKIIAGLSPSLFESAKAPLFPLLSGLIFFLGGGEAAIRFLLVFLPSIAVMVGAYILGAETFNKKVGLISMAIVSVFSHHLFYEARIMADMLANSLEVMAIALFVMFYINKKSPHLLFVPIVLGLLAFFTRYSACLSLIAIAIYLVLTERLSIFKNKNIMIAAGVSSIILLIFCSINYIIFGNIWPAAWHYLFSPVSGTSAIEAAHGAFNLSFLYAIFDWTNFGGGLLGTGTIFIYSLLPLFIIGISCFFSMFLALDKILKKDKDFGGEDAVVINKLMPVLMLFIWFSISAYFWVFIFHYATPRWAMGVAPAVIVISAYGYYILYNIIIKIVASMNLKKEFSTKLISIIIVSILLISSLTLMYERTDRMIDGKAGSYDYLKPTSLWLRDNVRDDEIIMFPSYIWYEYYTQRNNFVTDYDVKFAAFEHRNMTYLFLEEVPYGLIPVCEYDYEVALRDLNIDYFVWSVGQQVWTPTPDYMNKAMAEGILTGYANFNSNGMPASWIFKINKDALNRKIDNLEYQNQSFSIVTMEQWDPWNRYKQENNVNEIDICGYVYNGEGGIDGE